MIIHSKTTYKLEANAAKAGKHWETISQYKYIGTHLLPSGRFCFEFCTPEAFKFTINS